MGFRFSASHTNTPIKQERGVKMVVVVVGKVLTPTAAQQRSTTWRVDTTAAKWGRAGVDQTESGKERETEQMD